MAPKSKEMTPEQKEMVLALLNDGVSQRKISDMIGVSQSTISKFKKRYEQRGSVENIKRSGRKKITSVRSEHSLLRTVKLNRREPLATITNKVNEVIPRNISHRTVRRRLKFYGYSRRRVRKTLTVSLVNRKKRVAWCRSKLCWTVNQNWKKVIFSDETQVVIGNNQRVYVWRKSDELWRPECLGLRGASKVSVMFWGCICYTSVGTLVEIDGTMNSEKYIETLDSHLWPVVAKNFPNSDYIFQDDNAPCHKSARTQAWKRENDIPTLNWPSQSPDVNVIENVWRTMKIRLQTRVTYITNRATLISEVKKIWASLTPTYIQSLYASIPKRLRHVIIAKGHITKY